MLEGSQVGRPDSESSPTVLNLYFELEVVNVRASDLGQKVAKQRVACTAQLEYRYRRVRNCRIQCHVGEM
jgi:hypothetical protein